jgi:hypothetical protein
MRPSQDYPTTELLAVFGEDCLWQYNLRVFGVQKTPSSLEDGVFLQIRIYCVVITAATTALEVVVVAAEVPAEVVGAPPPLPPPPPQPANFSSIAAANANVISLDDFIAIPLELADAAKGHTCSLNQNCIAAIHGDRVRN